jgi:AcrR family transcriptional regulator
LNVVQNSSAQLRAVPSLSDNGTPPAGRRERTRLLRHRTYLRVALRIVTEEGLEALTMARLATEADAAVGTVYTYFPSKAALVAEVQREAIETLSRSYLLVSTRLEDRLASATAGPDRPDDATVALTRVLGFVRFWIAAFEAFPEEAGLNAMLLSHPTGMSPEDTARVMPAALHLLDQARARLDEATDAGALHPGDGTERVVTLAAAVTGVIQLNTLAPLDPELFDGSRLASRLALDLLSGWGAPASSLAAAVDRIDALAADGPLAPPVPDTDPIPEER